MQPKLALVALSLAVMLTACALPDPAKPQTNQTEPKDILASVVDTPRELLFHDIFMSDLVSSNVTVLGISVGMTDDDLNNTLGQPDQLVESDFGGVRDYMYGRSLGLSSTGFVFHSERGAVTRIIVKEAAAPLLTGASKPGRTKEQVYSVHGTPDRAYDFAFQLVGSPPEAEGITGRYFAYNQEGLEVYLDRTGEYQYAFVYPNRKLPSTSFQSRNLTREELLNPTLPTLMTDTTTLCNQGKTYAYNPSSAECISYVSACEIPDWWVEIHDCANRPPYVPSKTSNNTSDTQ